MDNKMTSEQRYWYLKGYVDCFAEDLSLQLNISKEEAKKKIAKEVVDRLEFDFNK